MLKLVHSVETPIDQFGWNAKPRAMEGINRMLREGRQVGEFVPDDGKVVGIMAWKVKFYLGDGDGDG